jgi:hypothetical protein
MARPNDEEYFELRTDHFAQGDIFKEVPFYYGDISPLKNPAEPFIATGFSGYGVLITYTSGMMNQPPGTPGYAHPWRLVAPLLSIAQLAEQGVFSDQQIDGLRSQDNFGRYMYVPSFPGEFRESVVVCHRPSLVHQEVLEGRRISQLQLPAALRLQEKLATTFLGGKWDPEDLHPDLSDHWNPS